MRNYRIVHPIYGFLSRVPPYNDLEFLRLDESGPALTYHRRDEAESDCAALGLYDCRIAEFDAYGDEIVRAEGD